MGLGMRMNVVEGYVNGNVVYIFPEGDVKRYDLYDSNGRIRVTRIVLGSGLTRDNRERLGDVLVMMGLIPPANFVVVPRENGFILIDSDSDLERFELKLS